MLSYFLSFGTETEFRRLQKKSSQGIEITQKKMLYNCVKRNLDGRALKDLILF